MMKTSIYRWCIPCLAMLALLSCAIDAEGQAREPIVETGSLTVNDSKNNDGSYFEDYKFTGSAGETATIDVTSDQFDTWLVVYGPSGDRVGSNDDRVSGNTDSQLVIALEDGEYRVKVTSHSAGETGDFKLTIAFAAPAREPIVERGSLTVNDPQHSDDSYYEDFKFMGSQGERVTIDLTSSDFDTHLFVYGPEGAETLSNDDRVEGDPDAGSRLELDLIDGEYKVRATSHGAGAETGNFELTIRFGAAVRKPIVERGSLTVNDGTTNDGSYYEEFKFTGSAGERVSIDLTSDDFDTHVLVYGPGGDVVGENDDRPGGGTNSLLELDLIDGEYSVLVTSHNPGDKGNFELTVTFQ